MNKSSLAGIAALLLALAVSGAWYWQRRQPVAAAAPGIATSTPQTASAVAAPLAQVASAPVSGIRYPIAVPAAAASAAIAAAGPASSPGREAEAELTELLGRKTVLGLFPVDEFAGRVAATVDNLGRAHAASRLWPVNPADGRFLTERRGDAEVVSADNGLRHTPMCC